MSDLKSKVDFKFIRYANCWEDADILVKGLAMESGAKMLSVASAGDNSFSLLTLNPEVVVAVDVNPIQLSLVKLKKLCFKYLDHADIIAFLGFKASNNRVEIYNKLSLELDSFSRGFFDSTVESIKNGIIHQGKFEKYFQLFAWKILPFIHTKSRINELFREKSSAEQLGFYTNHWNSWRWRLFFKMFFSKRVMGKYGRDPEFLKQVDLTVSEYIFQKAETELSHIKAQDNLFLFYNLNGHFGEFLPHYLREENYLQIKENIHRLETCEGYAEDAIQKYGKFNGMNLSNIFEYMNEDTFHKTATSLIEGMQSDGKIAYWNLMVPRRISSEFSNKVEYLEELSKQLSTDDKGFFYNCFTVDKIK